MKIEWDPAKNQANKKKHGISFEEASEIFMDPFHLSILEKRFEYGEERWITLGQTKRFVLLVTAHTWINLQGDETVKIISARKATRKERRYYENYRL